MGKKTEITFFSGLFFFKMECVVCHELITITITRNAICNFCENKPLDDVIQTFETKRRQSVTMPSELNRRVTIPDSLFRNDLQYLLKHWPTEPFGKINMMSSRHVDYLKNYIKVQILFLGRRMTQQCKPIATSISEASCHNDQRLIGYIEMLKLKICIELRNKAKIVWSEAVSYYTNTLLPYIHVVSILEIVYDYAPLCQCRCTFLKHNLQSRSPLQIKIGCLFVVCGDDHIACTCCQFPNNGCNLRYLTSCSICAILCGKCCKMRCHWSCEHSC